MNNKQFEEWIDKHNIKQIITRDSDIPIPKVLLAILRIVIETAYDDGYKEGYSDGKYGPYPE